MFKSTIRTLSLVLALVLLLTVGGVYATWTYTLGYTEPKSQELGVSLSVFDYPPDEILPGGDQNDEPVTPGANHFALIDLILNESNKGYGLNYSDNVLLHQYLRSDRVIYSNQNVQGGNLKFLLDDKNNTQGLYYCIKWVSDTEYHVFTFSKDDLATAGGSAVEIAAYKTILKKNTKWEATTSYLGYALTYSLYDLDVEPGQQADIHYSIDMEQWHT